MHVLRQCTYSSFIKISPPLLKGLANVALQRLGMLLHKGVEPSPIYLLCVLHGPILGMFGSPPARLNFQNRLKKNKKNFRERKKWLLWPTGLFYGLRSTCTPGRLSATCAAQFASPWPWYPATWVPTPLSGEFINCLQFP